MAIVQSTKLCAIVSLDFDQQPDFACDKAHPANFISNLYFVDFVNSSFLFEWVGGGIVLF